MFFLARTSSNVHPHTRSTAPYANATVENKAQRCSFGFKSGRSHFAGTFGNVVWKQGINVLVLDLNQE